MAAFKDIKTETTSLERKLIPFTSIDITSFFGHTTTSIQDICYLKENEKILILANQEEKETKTKSSKLYLFNQRQMLKTWTFDTTNSAILFRSSNPDELLCCAPSKKQIQKVNLKSAESKPTCLFETSGECWGIVDFNNGFAILLNMKFGYPNIPDWQVQFLDYDGKVKQQICYDTEGKALFVEPQYMTTNEEKNILYISDTSYSWHNVVVALDTNGKILQTLKHETIKQPKGLATDDERNIYIACALNLLQLQKDKDGADSKVLISTPQSGGKAITRVCFKSNPRRLAIAEANSTIVKVFSFTS